MDSAKAPIIAWGSYTRDEKNLNPDRSETEIAALKNFQSLWQMNTDE